MNHDGETYLEQFNRGERVCVHILDATVLIDEEKGDRRWKNVAEMQTFFEIHGRSIAFGSKECPNAHRRP